MSSPFLALSGAVDAVGRDAGIPAHYGSPLIEQRQLRESGAIVDLSTRAVLTITGPDRLSWLNSISSQQLTGLEPGQSAETLLLNVNGRLEHAVRLLDDGETMWLLIEPGEASGLFGWLESMRFMLRVELADRTDDYATVGYLDAPATTVPATTVPATTVHATTLPIASAHGVPLIWHDPWPSVVAGGHQYALATEHPGVEWSWTEALVPRSELASIAEQVASGEITAAGLVAAEALRIAAWRPRFATEVDEKTIPHELDWLRTAVHLNKGCYRGQETVAKVHNLGHPPRRLVMLHLDGSDAILPVAGDEVWVEKAGERSVVGRVTSSAIHYELGPIALAVVKRQVDAGTTLNVDSQGIVVAASQEVVVPTDAGASAEVPRLPRLGAVRRR